MSITKRQVVEEREQVAVLLKDAYEKQLAAYEADKEADICLDVAEAGWRTKKDQIDEPYIRGRDAKERDAHVLLLTMKERERAFDTDIALKKAAAELDQLKRRYDMLGHICRLFEGHDGDEI